VPYVEIVSEYGPGEDIKNVYIDQQPNDDVNNLKDKGYRNGGILSVDIC